MWTVEGFRFVQNHMSIRQKLKMGEWLVSKQHLFENEDIQVFLGLCQEHLGQLLRYDASEMKNVTRIPPVADNGYGVSPVVGSQFRTHQIHPENVQSNAGLVAMLRNLKGKLDRRVVTVMLVDVGVFIRVIKVF